MESVTLQLRQARENKKKTQVDTYIYETVVDNCEVIMRFGRSNDNLETIRSMLLSAHLDNVFTMPSGGESA